MFVPGVTKSGQFVPNLLRTIGRTDGQCSNCVTSDAGSTGSRYSDTQHTAVHKTTGRSTRCSGGSWGQTQHCNAYRNPTSHHTSQIHLNIIYNLPHSQQTCFFPQYFTYIILILSDNYCLSPMVTQPRVWAFGWVAYVNINEPTGSGHRQLSHKTKTLYVCRPILYVSLSTLSKRS